MFWRSVVVKLWFTILLFFSFVLLTLTIFLLQFFQNFHETQAREELEQDANKIISVINGQDDRQLMTTTIEQITDPSKRVVLVFNREDYWKSSSKDQELESLDINWFYSNEEFKQVLNHEDSTYQKTTLPDTDREILIVGQPLENQNGAVFLYESLDIVKETTSQTTTLIFIAAGIAIVLTTFFAFFLSTRITAPLIKMRKAALELAKGEFHTKVPILTRDEVGELAIAFNRMGRQLKYHIQALNQEKEQLSSILSSMADGVITFNRSGEMLVTNPPADRFLSLSTFEKGDNQEEEVTPLELKSTLERVIASEEEVTQEIQLQGRTFVVIMSPLYDQLYIRGAVAVIRDMTEERKLDKLRKDFIANVSHELRTPISMLQGYSEAIVDGVADSKEEKNELAQIIHDESMRMGRLVNELLDIARMEAGHIQLNVQEVELEPFLNKVLNKFKGMANEKEITLKPQFQLEEPVVRFDPDRMEQVLTNLIDNAIRHSYKEGNVELQVISNGEHMKFSVKDSGSGIPEEDLPFVFERFYKSDKSRVKRKGSNGTGLGLAIVKNIVEAHKGSIDVHSKQNEGTTFIFVIPRNL
ncbi:two-component system, OmpR family, sensor histidine kinase ResE [Salinibacillus kushneri]|uniref:histidine kinase n=1 Tax=Salinibacillus kushneri TaxID=237682 RepID=A0A1I0I0S9_9BACI|nr:ATP-binding protein [Salinibacillus kushneri]SET89247.1 two-component system, OmpR family, sensor histidine kinase ResE [Salinibacillus kushneri]